MPQRTWTVGLLGAGYIADWHCTALASVPGTRIIAACDRDASRAADLARRHGIAAHFTDLDAMLSGASPDVVHILLPPEHHFAAAKRVLEAGKHVLLEKPKCLKPEECSQLGDLAQERGLAVGTSHNFLFFPAYEQLRDDIGRGLLGRIDHVTITWHKELGQLRSGPFSGWLLAAPGNIMLEVGPHSVAHLLDLVGVPDRLDAEANHCTELPTGVRFCRRWLVRAYRGDTCVDLRFAFGKGFPEHVLHVRGSAGSATVDFERNTYVLRRQGPRGVEFDRYDSTMSEGRTLCQQARVNLLRYGLSKLKLSQKGNAYRTSIARSLAWFYEDLCADAVDARQSAAFAAKVMATCRQIAESAGLAITESAMPRPPVSAPSRSATVLVLGGSGFIGQALVRKLVETGHAVRLLVRDPGKLPASLQSLPIDVMAGDMTRRADLNHALSGIHHVYHLARGHGRTWDDYQRLDVAPTRQVAEACLAHGVQRLFYTGTIDSYYSGDARRVIDEQTPLDPHIDRRNLYARAKAESERILLDLHRERGLPVVIFRPGVVVGRGAAPFHWGVGFWAGESVCRLWGDGDQQVPLVLVEDVAQALANAIAAEDGIVGESFNLVGDPCLTAREYVESLEQALATKIDVRPTAPWWFYAVDLFKYGVKCLVRHPERRLPSYRDWQTRSHRSRFDCTKAKQRLRWEPTRDREAMIREGILRPAQEWLA